VIDGLGREISYMRISITDRCNLRCSYCMPTALPNIPHGDILRYEEFLRICRAAVKVGIRKFKVTGGEPLVRAGAVEFITSLKKTPGVECVTLTTNGMLLEEALPALAATGIDGVNISLDAVSPELYRQVTGKGGVEQALGAVRACVKSGIHTKVNAVLLKQNRGEAPELVKLAEKLPVDVRFIELMPIGEAKGQQGPDIGEVYERLKRRYPDLHYVDEKRGNGPAVYYRSKRLLGRLGFIGANSHQFCGNCNRVRLTSTGLLKPCLCYEGSTDLRSLLRGGAGEKELVRALAGAVFDKPSAHCFDQDGGAAEQRLMNQIGG